MNVREIAYNILTRVEHGKFAQDLLEETPNVPSRDRALLTQIVYGTIRHQGALDKLITEHTSPENKIILRIAAYQMFFLSKIPEYAIVNESVEIAKKNSTAKSARFINAVLRKWCRNRPKIDDSYSYPEWLLKRWERFFGKNETRSLCDFNNEIPPILVRINTLKNIPQNVLDQFERTIHPAGFLIKEKGHIKELAGFTEGYFQAQDISGLFVVDLLDVSPSMAVLDLCASPGGKTCYIAQVMENRGEITAVDVSKEKLKPVEENCKRMGVSIVKSVVGDGRNVNLGKFDRILIDAPCSNTGVLRRRVEARWRLKEEDFGRLAKKQLELLENAARQLKTDGKMVYSTCSIDLSENEDVVEKFLSRHKEFKLAGVVKKVPHVDNMDGVFGALLERK